MAKKQSASERDPNASGSKKPKRFGKYDIVKLLGQGGMGKVYMATDRDLKRTVAIKFLSKQKAENPLLVKRFKAEGQAAAVLNHENIIRVYDFGEHNGQLFMALEYVDGQDTHQILHKRGTFPVSRSIEIIQKTALALQHAAEHGIVHRDIKPSNIMLRKDGVVKLADMGLARSLEEDEDAGITRAGTTVGTVDYMSPEQARDSKSADIRSDQYSLGATWYQLLTGQPPFPDGDLTNKLRAHATARRPDPADLNDQVPEAVSSVISRMMSIDADARYQTIPELLEDIDSILSGKNAVLDAVLGDSTQHVTSNAMTRELTSSSESGHFAGDEVDFDPLDDDTGLPAHRAQKTVDAENGEPVIDPATGKPIPADSAGQKGQAKRRHQQDGAAAASDDDSSDASGSRAKASASSKASGKKRSLPPRNSKTAAANNDTPQVSRSLDPDVIRNVLVGTGILTLLGGVVWFVTSQSGGGSGAADSTVGNPYAVDQQAVQQPQPVNPAANAEETVDNGKRTPPVNSVVGAKNRLTPEEEKRLAALPPLAPKRGAVIPDWVDIARLKRFPPRMTVTVKPGAAKKGEYASLKQALDAIPASGGRVLLEGHGPYRLDRTTIRNTSRVHIEASESDGPRPVIEIVGDSDPTPILDLAHTNLVLAGVDVFLRADAPSSGRRPWIGVDTAALYVFDSSFTDVSGEKESVVLDVTVGRVPGVVFRQNPGQTLLTDCTVRGASTTAVSVRAAAVDAVVGNCYFDSGRRPAVVYATAKPPAKRTKSRDNTPAGARRMLVIGSAIFSDAAALALEHLPETPIDSIDVRLEQSLLAAGGTDATLVTIEDWEKGKGRGPKAVTVTVPKSSLVGWKQLARWDDGNRESVATDPTTWREVFARSPVLTNQLSDATLDKPMRVEQPENAADFPSIWKSQFTERVGAELLHCDLSRLAWPTEGYGDRFLARSQWPTPPDVRAPLFETVGEPIEFSLGKGKQLGPFLKGNDVPDGSEVRITGQGVVDLTETNLETKRVRLVCDQSNGGITIRCKVNRRTARPTFAVSGGTLELVNAVLELPPLAGAALPQAVFEIDGGTVALRNCQVVDAAKDRPPTSVFRATGPDSRVLVTDSLLAGPGAVVDGGNDIQLVTANSALLMGGPVARGGTTSFLTHCTVRTGLDVVEAGDNPDTRFWAEKSVLSPSRAIVGAADAAVLRAVDWYDSENVLSDASQTTKRQGNDGVPVTVESWASTWPSGHVGLVRVESLPPLGAGKPVQELTRDELQLGEDSQAIRPTSDGRPPGVNVDTVGTDRPRPKRRPNRSQNSGGFQLSF